MFARKYETITLVDSDRGDEGREKVLSRIREALDKTGAREVRFEDWGRRKLAYRLRRSKASKAHYLYLLYLGGNKTVAEVERLLKITEEALLWQTVVLDDRVKVDEFDFDGNSEAETIMASKTKEAAARAKIEAAEAERLRMEAVEEERRRMEAVEEERRRIGATSANGRCEMGDLNFLFDK